MEQMNKNFMVKSVSFPTTPVHATDVPFLCNDGTSNIYFFRDVLSAYNSQHKTNYDTNQARFAQNFIARTVHGELLGIDIHCNRYKLHICYMPLDIYRFNAYEFNDVLCGCSITVNYAAVELGLLKESLSK